MRRVGTMFCGSQQLVPLVKDLVLTFASFLYPKWLRRMMQEEQTEFSQCGCLGYLQQDFSVVRSGESVLEPRISPRSLRNTYGTDMHTPSSGTFWKMRVD